MKIKPTKSTFTHGGEYTMPKEYCYICGGQLMYMADEAIVPFATAEGVQKVHEACIATLPQPKKEEPRTKEEVLKEVPSYDDWKARHDKKSTPTD